MGAVSYTHLRAHETDTSLFVGSVKMCIRDSSRSRRWDRSCSRPLTRMPLSTMQRPSQSCSSRNGGCLLYTSPSPRDGHLSIRRQRQDVYKRQQQVKTLGPVVLTAANKNATVDNATAESKLLIQKWGRPDFYPKAFAGKTVAPLDPAKLQEAFDIWQRKVGSKLGG